MKLAIMQPYWFPYIGYFQLLQAVDKFVFYDDVNFIKQGWINRNRIVVSQQDKLITIPLHKASSYQKIRYTNVAFDTKQKEQMIRTLYQAYAKAPYRSKIINLVEQSFDIKQTSISDFAASSIHQVINYLKLKSPEFVYSEKYGNSTLVGQERVLDICIKENCTTYINSIGGVKLYNREHFLSKGVNLRFLETTFQQYPQLSPRFIPGLSIIDILMMNSPDTARKMLTNYNLLTPL